MKRKDDRPNDAESPGHIPYLVDCDQLRSLLGVPYSRVTIWRMRRDGKFPQPVKAGERALVWRSADIIEWVRARSPEAAYERLDTNALVTLPAKPEPSKRRQPVGPLKPASVRDTFAMHALTALGGHKAVAARGIPWLVEHAYMVADAMLEEREKEPKPWN